MDSDGNGYPFKLMKRRNCNTGENRHKIMFEYIRKRGKNRHVQKCKGKKKKLLGTRIHTKSKIVEKKKLRKWICNEIRGNDCL